MTAFTIPRTNIDVIKLVDPLHLAHMTADAVAVPKFAKGSNVYQNIYGAASSTFELINAAPAEVYSYSYESSRGDAVKEGANKQVISSQADSLIKISRIWADFFPQTHRISLFRLFFPPFLALFPVFTEISP